MKPAAIAGLLAFTILAATILWTAFNPPQRGDAEQVAPVAECPGAGDCGEATAAVDPALPAIDYDTMTLSSGRKVVPVFERTCAACHIAGLAGAPRLGNHGEWRPRIEKGLDALYLSARAGMPPGMPAKGLCYDCTPEDLAVLVDYMLAKSR